MNIHFEWREQHVPNAIRTTDFFMNLDVDFSRLICLMIR